MLSTNPREVGTLLAVAAFGALTALAPAAVLPPRLVAPVPSGPGMHDLGRAPTASVRLAIVLNYRNESQLDQLIEDQGDAASPLSNFFLTAAQFRAYFSPTAQTYARTIESLRHAGFTITHTFANRTVIDASASASVVNRYFGTDIHRIGIDGMGIHYANARPAYLPEELRGAVHSVLGFDNIEWFKPLYHINQSGGGSIPLTVIGQPLKGPGGGYGPLAFAQGYDMPVQHQIPGQPQGTTYDGTGRTAGIAIPADPKDSDLSKFLSEFKVTRTGTTTRVPVDGGATGGSSGANLEAALDYETIAGVAPGANIDIFEFPTFSSQDLLDTYNTAVSDNVADTVNSSFGACEQRQIFSATGIAHIFKQGAAQGQTFHSSSGDSGTETYGCSSGNATVLTPTDTPYGLSIGGTRLNTDSNGNWTSESYWNDSSGAGGGGVSVVFKAPKWQKRAGIHESGRAVPDISFDADPVTGEDMVFDGSFIDIGGTSLASPITGGCLVELEQVLGKRITRQLRTLYHNWHTDGYASGTQTFAHDITTGTAFGILKPGVGYDLATGIGSLDCFVGAPKYF